MTEENIRWGAALTGLGRAWRNRGAGHGLHRRRREDRSISMKRRNG
jgi:hypothetical protein